MTRFDKVIFICTSNTFSGPVAEAIYRDKAPNWLPEVNSRGLVVLFSEPISPKVNIILCDHEIGISDHKNSKQLLKEEITQDTLLLTMTFQEKVQLMEDFQVEKNVYTIGEFIEEDTDLSIPYGSEEDVYHQFFEELLKRVERVILRMEALYYQEEIQKTEEMKVEDEDSIDELSENQD